MAQKSRGQAKEIIDTPRPQLEAVRFGENGLEDSNPAALVSTGKCSKSFSSPV